MSSVIHEKAAQLHTFESVCVCVCVSLLKSWKLYVYYIGVFMKTEDCEGESSYIWVIMVIVQHYP